ncbi:MAG: enoyl-CoA hydratase/isomerase family protein [Ectothiorhodospiraceae bacterium]|nr:enoyl-CoA hydratase/isomerase family protein [Ectothiorhodospiraceae bacterium]
MSTVVSLEKRGSVAVVCIDKPPVNALGRAVRDGLQQAFEQVRDDDAIKAAVLCTAGRTFVAGADIAEFEAPDFDASLFHQTLDMIEGLDKPVVAALHGTALGGGLELALACHYRVASPGTRVGLPEVTLGLLPGAAGTQRLPRIAGASLALDMIITGKPIDAGRALEAGLIDQIVKTDLLEGAIAVAEERAEQDAPVRRISEMQVDPATVPESLFQDARESLRRRPTGNPAPERIIQCVEAAVNRPFPEGVQVEARLFQECRESRESAALRYRFFAEREAAKIPGLPKDLSLREIRTVGVVGAGTMGGGIAMNFANVGIPVKLLEVKQEALDKGLAVIRRNYENTAKKGRISMDDVEKRMSLIQGTLSYDDLAGADLVIEAVFENMDIKRQVLGRLGQVCREGAIIASNTSTLDVDELARATGRPTDVLGMHFFSPANVMRLLEVVRGEQTAPDVLATVMKLAKAIGKVPVVSGVCYGFIGNRMLEPYLRETEFLLMEGASPAQVDRAIQSLGLAMGPCRMIDLAGVDVAAKVVQEHAKAGGLPDDPAYRAVVQKLMAEGRHGQKTEAGYYRYEDRKPVDDPEVARICAELAEEHGIQQRSDITDQEIIERCLYPLINEGARILEEGISYRPGDIDTVWINGYGFPDWLGGPMFWADTIGVPEIARRLAHYGEARGNAHGYWDQAALLERMVADGLRFADWPFDG